MKQIVQESGNGTVRLADVPAPVVRPGGVLVSTRHSVISIGTERMKLDFGRKTLLGKARERPDQVRTVLETAAREGVAATYRKVRARLAELSPLGYSLAGVVDEVGEGVHSLRVGDVVACAGAGYANHAERVWVPENLAVRVPEGVPTEAAAFATVGAIAMHGIRQAELSLGEVAAVVGLGLLGQLTVQMLRAAGVGVVAVDVNESRVALARHYGAAGVLRRDDVEGAVHVATAGVGVDATIVTAATSSDDPIRLAGRITRERGRLVLVGAVPLRVPRSPYYEKEIEVRLSRSYGPGRYDPSYEEGGHDYPIGYVRWTERRNIAEFVRMLSTGAIDMDGVITHRFPFSDAERAYEELTARGSAALGVVLEYPQQLAPEPRRIVLGEGGRATAADRPGIGVIGAGSFATATLLPLLSKLPVRLVGVATAGGVRARDAAEKFGFRYMAGSADELCADPDIAAVIIATRHADHAVHAAAALRAGKAVFVEKPLALDDAALDDVAAAAVDAAPLMVGFNRRFAPATQFLRSEFAGVAGARVVQIRVNAGSAPSDSWVHDPAVGGGRLLGEGCHFIDLAAYLAGAPIVEVHASGIGPADPAAALRDNVQVTLHFADGSLGSIIYTSKGETRSGKERVEMYAGGRSGMIDDFRLAEVHGPAGRKRWKGTQDKGHAAELKAFADTLRQGGPSPIPLADLVNSSRATIAAAQSLATGQSVQV
jgi:predicted dehydrogenase/threonine dehydrogenase-like Zn-dependent dehydrogenase